MPKPDRILAVDPGSNRAGWAVLGTTIPPGGEPPLIDGGRWVQKSGHEPHRRLDALMEDINGTVPGLGVKIAVIEITSGHAHQKDPKTGRRRPRMVGLATYGAAIFAVRTALKALGLKVVELKENDWTGGSRKQGPRSRQQYCAVLYPTYNAAGDGGADFSDAIMLARHYILQMEAKGWEGVDDG